jgi:hypothetical protein
MEYIGTLRRETSRMQDAWFRRGPDSRGIEGVIEDAR